MKRTRCIPLSGPGALLLVAVFVGPAFAQLTTTTTMQATTTTVRATTTVPTTTTTSTTLPPALVCQNRAASIFGNLTRRFLLCDAKDERKGIRGQEFDVEACRRRFVDRFVRRFPRKVKEQACPQCVLGARDRLQARAEGVAVTSPAVQCDEPDQRSALACATRVRSRLSALIRQLVDCRIREATAGFRAEEFDEGRCRNRAQARYDKAVNGLKGCPECLGPEVRAQAGTTLANDVLPTLDGGVAHCSCLYGVGTCDDANTCTTDACGPTGDCTHAASNPDGPCDDNDDNPCTTGACDSGGRCNAVATNEGGQCADDGNECTDDTCAAGVCTHAPRTDGTPCADGDLCNGDETCVRGACTSGPAPICLEDDRPCTRVMCDPRRGCAFENRDGPCEDGSACTENDLCVGGSCEGEFVDCNDGERCTLDTCSAVTGCVFIPIFGCE
jgi:hypothetical protein